jgi:hypothetical protein
MVQNQNLPLHPLDIYLYIHFTFDRKHIIQKLLLGHNFSTSRHIAHNTNKPFNKLWYSKK